jgi:GGDEF domain-containing protein
MHVRLNGKALGLVNPSAGLASYSANGSPGPLVIGEADAALYRAKQNGRDRIEGAASNRDRQTYSVAS